jgi:hypothetical protein
MPSDKVHLSSDTTIGNRRHTVPDLGGCVRCPATSAQKALSGLRLWSMDSQSPRRRRERHVALLSSKDLSARSRLPLIVQMEGEVALSVGEITEPSPVRP